MKDERIQLVRKKKRFGLAATRDKDITADQNARKLFAGFFRNDFARVIFFFFF